MRKATAMNEIQVVLQEFLGNRKAVNGKINSKI